MLHGVLQAKRVGGFSAVDTPGVMWLLKMTTEAREAVARPRAGVHGRDGPPRYRVVVDHRDPVSFSVTQWLLIFTT